MPIPFRKTIKRPAMRRIILPFTMGLMLIGFTACIAVGA